MLLFSLLFFGPFETVMINVSPFAMEAPIPGFDPVNPDSGVSGNGENSDDDSNEGH